MAAFFIVHIDILDPHDRHHYDEYVAKVKPIVEHYGGRYLVRSENISLCLGPKAPDRIIVIEFENRYQLEQCFSSAAYQSIQGLREHQVNSCAFIVEQ